MTLYAQYLVFFWSCFVVFGKVGSIAIKITMNDACRFDFDQPVSFVLQHRENSFRRRIVPRAFLRLNLIQSNSKTIITY